jgi:hypothetical protein
MMKMSGQDFTLNTAEMTEIIRRHRWSDRTKGCACGWTQRKSVARGHEHLNYPHHLVERITASRVSALPDMQWVGLQ